MKPKTIALILLLVASFSSAKDRPPTLDPNSCPTPYDPNVLTISSPMAWLPADVNVSVISQINVWNRTGRTVDVVMQELVSRNNQWTIQTIDHTIQSDNTSPVLDPNGGYNQQFTYGFTPTEARIYYLLFTALTPSKPQWKTERRLVLVYVEAEDIPILWVQDVPLLTTKNAQRLWQASVKAGTPMTKPSLVRLSHD